MKTNDLLHSTQTGWATVLLVAAATAALTISAQAASQPCVLFDDVAGDSVQSDGGGQYCNAPKKNVTVAFSNDGHLALDTNSSNKPGAGRNLFIDFGAPITVVDPNNNTVVLAVFQKTDELATILGPDRPILHDVNLNVGAFQDDFNMLAMALDEVQPDINLRMTLHLHFPGRAVEVPVFVKLDGRICEDSGAVRVTRNTANSWHIETQDPNNQANVSQDPNCNTYQPRNLSFGFTVTK